MGARSDEPPVPPQRWLAEPRRPPAIREWPNAFWLAVAAVCIGAFMGQLDASIVTVALPTLQRYFQASLGAVTWVGLSYLLVLVAGVVAVGRVADMVGRKLLYIYGFVVFIIGSALCGLAPSLPALNGLRVLQGLGAALLQANSVAIIAVVVPADRLGRAIGIQGAAQAIGLAMGPTIGGLLLAAGGWRLIFFVNVPFGVIGTAAGWVFIPRSRHLAKWEHFDWIGLACFLPAVAGLLAAVSLGNSAGWSSPLVVVGLAAGVVLGAAFVWWERRTAAPMLDLSLFARARFSAGIASGLLSYLVLFGVLFIFPFLLERGLGMGTAESGAVLMTMPVVLGAVAPFAGRLADRIGARPLTVGGASLAAAGLALAALWRGSLPVLVVSLGVVGAGMGLFTPPNNAAIMGSAPRHQSGVASGVLNMTRGLGTALGLAVAGAVLGLAGGAAVSAAPSTVSHAFAVSAWLLAGLLTLAAAIASLSSTGPLDRDPVHSAE